MALDFSDNKSNIWIATVNGVSVLTASKIDSAEIHNPIRSDNSGLVSNRVSSVAVDTGQVKWFGTDQGISFNINEVWETYTKWDLLPANVILAIAATLDNWVYLGTASGGVARVQYDKVDGISGASTIDTDWSSIASDTVLSILIDSDDNKWYGNSN